MTIFLFSLNLKIVFVISLFFLFIVPILLKFISKKWLYITYLIIYTIILILGVFLDVSISDSSVKLSILFTNKWANNNLSFFYINSISILINLFLLFPYGFFLPLISNKFTFLKLIIIGLFMSLFVEILQFLLPIIRYPEVLDVINNVISVILGYIYYLLISKSLTRGEKNDRLSKQENNSKN